MKCNKKEATRYDIAHKIMDCMMALNSADSEDALPWMKPSMAGDPCRYLYKALSGIVTEEELEIFSDSNESPWQDYCWVAGKRWGNGNPR